MNAEDKRKLLEDEEIELQVLKRRRDGRSLNQRMKRIQVFWMMLQNITSRGLYLRHR